MGNGRNYKFDRGNKLHVWWGRWRRAGKGSVSMQIYQDDKKANIGDHGPPFIEADRGPASFVAHI